MSNDVLRPTEECYAELQQAYDHFNQTLFEGQLPGVLISLQRDKRTMGYFSDTRFVNKAGAKTDEIALNPSFFASVSVEETLAILVHQQVHQWQQHFGDKARRGYHDKQWAAKMVELGLQPTHDGRRGGKTTGEHMDQYIIPDGPFIVACKALLGSAFGLSWYDRFPERIERPPAEPGSHPPESAPEPEASCDIHPRDSAADGNRTVAEESDTDGAAASPQESAPEGEAGGRETAPQEEPEQRKSPPKPPPSALHLPRSAAGQRDRGGAAAA